MFLMTQTFCFVSYTIRKGKKEKEKTLHVVLVYYLKKKKIG